MNKSKSLAETNPELIKEWHPYKNGNLTPFDVTAGSNKKVWWLLSYDDPESGKHFEFEWQAYVKHRANGVKCPVLSGKMIHRGFNDLASKYPDIAKEWHPNKNGSLTPYDVSWGCEKKVWWIREYEDSATGKRFVFEWEASVLNRVNGAGCPYISGHEIYAGFNDLATTHPDLIKEWNYEKNGDLTPQKISKGSNKIVWWKLPFDDPYTGKHFEFEWQDSVSHRTNGVGCPFLSGHAVFTGYNDLQTTNPNIAKEWHPDKNGELMPTAVSAGSLKKVWWKLPYDDPKTGKHFDFEWQASIASRVRGNGCPFISNKAIWIGFNDLATTNPDLAKEWHPTKNGGLTPSQFTYGDADIVWWYLPYDDPNTGKHFDFEWKAQISGRAHGLNCPYLSGQAVWKGFNDLSTVAPEIAKEWHPTKNEGLSPDEVTQFSTKKVWWYLPYDDPNTGKHYDFEWQAPISSRSSGTKCPYLSGASVWTGFNDLSTVNPQLTKEWDYTKNHGDSPEKVSCGSTKNIWWICPKMHSYRATVASRTRGRGCPVCSSERSTSLPEYIIYYYVKKIDNTVVHSYKELGFELDVFIPKKNIGIEYDGVFWHKNKEKLDVEKNRKCKSAGIKLYRFRENELGSLNDTSIDICANERDFPNRLQELLQEIFGCAVDVNIDRDYFEINDLRTFSEKDNSLLALNPELAKEWHPTKNGLMTPETVTANSSKMAWWIFPYDDPKTGKHFEFEWKAAISDRNNGNGCPFISNKAVWPGFNDLQTERPDVACYWHTSKNEGLKASDVSVGSEKKVWWYMPYDDPNTGKHFDFEWFTSIDSQVRSNNCPYITGHAVWKGFNDLQTVNPKLALEWHPTKNGNLLPSEVTASSGKKAWWLLPYDDPDTGKHFDFEWESKIASRNMGSGCPYLLQQAVWPGYNDLATTCPDVASEWNYDKNGDLLPKMVTKGSSKKVWWRCQNGHEWQATISNRVGRGSGCPYCKSTR